LFQTEPFSQVHLTTETAVEFSRLERILQSVYFQSFEMILVAGKLATTCPWKCGVNVAFLSVPIFASPADKPIGWNVIDKPGRRTKGVTIVTDKDKAEFIITGNNGWAKTIS
jgi:hypothetical protein